MRQVRVGVFETNSSSTHSLTLCSKAKFEAWKKGELKLYQERLMTNEEVESLKSESKYFYEEEVQTYEQFNDDYSGLEAFEEEHTTESGDVVVAFGKYGYEG